MKKFVLSLCLLFTFAATGMANSFTLPLSTYVPTVELGFLAGSWPSLDGKGAIGNIILTNSGATVQTVTFYKLSESSSTATIIGYAVVPTTGTETVSFEGEIFDDLALIKSATGTTVTATVFYK